MAYSTCQHLLANKTLPILEDTDSVLFIPRMVTILQVAPCCKTHSRLPGFIGPVLRLS